MEFLDLLQQQNKTISDLLNEINQRDILINELRSKVEELDSEIEYRNNHGA